LPNGMFWADGSPNHLPHWNVITSEGYVTSAGMKREELSYNGIKYLKYTPTTLPIKGAILHLSGMGERGSNLALLENTEIPKQLKNGLEVPYIVVCPQLPSSYGGWYGNITGPIIEMMKGYGVDLHLAGLSLGGMSVPTIISEKPGVFKTAATVCGKAEGNIKAAIYAEISKIPSVHYYDPSDQTISYGYSSIKGMCDDLKLKADITFVQLKGYPNAHNIWQIAYLPENYWKWLDSKVTPLPLPVKETIIEQWIEGGKLYSKGSNGTIIIN